jgi:hypothetical protein
MSFNETQVKPILNLTFQDDRSAIIAAHFQRRRWGVIPNSSASAIGRGRTPTTLSRVREPTLAKCCGHMSGVSPAGHDHRAMKAPGNANKGSRNESLSVLTSTAVRYNARSRSTRFQQEHILPFENRSILTRKLIYTMSARLN